MNTILKDKNTPLFTPEDIRQIKRLGLDLHTITNQLAMHRKGATFLKLKKPCTVNDGILSFSPEQMRKLITFYEKESKKYQLIKFVPASGAASRMFSEWFQAAEKGSFGSTKLDKLFWKNLRCLPFSHLIMLDKKGREHTGKKDIGGLLNHILSSDGFNYGKLPKALIPFHSYPSGKTHNALEEHICEACYYISDASKTCHLHFTLAPGFKREVATYLKKVIAGYEKSHKIKFKITLSNQELSTNTLAVDKNGEPLRNERGNLVYRPGGHGTLLKNLNRLNADFVFVKNIDNVAPENMLRRIIPYKKMMGGLAMRIQEEIFTNIRHLKNPKISPSQIEKIISFFLERLNIDFSQKFRRLSQKEKIKILFSILNRPLRVCAMVSNEKEPGGGPFWVEEKDGTLTRQIVESVHVDARKKSQVKIWSEAQYFNPVDMVCGIKNYQGKKFNLFNYVNNEAYLIAAKSEKGREIKALEVPGLWNGSMAYWNTIFVKVPLVVFNPVKNVSDLLRPEHLIP